MSVAASVRDSASILPSPHKKRVASEGGKITIQVWTPQKRDLRLGPVPGSSCVRLSIVLLFVIFLPCMHCDQESLLHSLNEIIIPQELTFQGEGDPAEGASYRLYMQGQKQVIHLRMKKDYFVSNFPVFSYHSGILEQETLSVSHDCHYEGHIQGAPGSFVSLNTCSGLKGILIKEGQSYGIEPLESSKRFEHVLYTMAHQAPVSCSVTSKKSQQGVSASRQQGSRKLRNLKVPSYLWSHTKYVEMFVVVNHRRFQMWGSDVNETIQGVMDIIALANSFTRGIHTEVVLVGMEIWTEGDLTEVLGDLQVTLRNFNSWRRQKLLSRVKHDVAHLIVGQHPGQTMGQAFLSGACSSGFAAAVESFHHDDVLLFAALMVHELGHNLGMQHDHSACICKDKYFCLMYENVTKVAGFSNCSSDSFYQFLHEQKGSCLFNKPGHKGRTRRDAVCGNGVVEDTEECDCGPNCDTHPCCDPACRLKKYAECSNGLCCSNCLLKQKGHMCRPAGDECDLPEYCQGSSEECPVDTYKQDGTPCERINYCFRGQCRSPDKQCATLFGPTARSASEDCYQSINYKGDRFGNCGRPSENDPLYVQCVGDNIFCGKLVCTDVTNIPAIKPNHTLIQIPYEDDWCWSMDASNDSDFADDGDVQAGTYCAPDKVCMNYFCVDHTVFNYNCKPAEMCNGRGVCNNFRHCHCEPGFAPPDCSAQGDGGSVDSGPGYIVSEENTLDSSIRIKSSKNSVNKAVFIIPAFLAGLLFGLLVFISLSSRKKPPEAPAEAPAEAFLESLSEAPLEEPPGAPAEEPPEALAEEPVAGAPETPEEPAREHEADEHLADPDTEYQ